MNEMWIYIRSDMFIVCFKYIIEKKLIREKNHYHKICAYCIVLREPGYKNKLYLSILGFAKNGFDTTSHPLWHGLWSKIRVLV